MKTKTTNSKNSTAKFEIKSVRTWGESDILIDKIETLEGVTDILSNLECGNESSSTIEIVEANRLYFANYFRSRRIKTGVNQIGIQTV
jgi:hypothetical protein